MSTIYLVTHAGTAHSDDLLATAFLKKYFAKKRWTVVCIRTSDVTAYRKDEFESRENEITTSENGVPSLIYDTGLGLFDHHQKDARVRRNGIKLCGFGLLWERYGLDYLRDRYGNSPDFDIKDAFDIFERDFVMGIDMHDNGQKVDGIVNNISGLLSRLRPDWDSDEAIADLYFKKATEISDLMFDVEIKKAVSAARAIPIVHASANAAISFNRQFCILHQLVPHQQLILSDEKYKDILYVIYPSAHIKEEWSVSALPIKFGLFPTRKPLPKCLRALPRNQLMVRNWTFVHATGFLGSAVSLDDAIKLAEYAISAPAEEEEGDILKMAEWPKKETTFSDDEFSVLKTIFESCTEGLCSFGFADRSKEKINFYSYSFKGMVDSRNIGLKLDPDNKYHIESTYHGGHDMGTYGSITKK